MDDFWDVIIVGGGVIGSASAYFLMANPDFKGRVLVVERDPTYQDCSTARSAGGIRQQFSTPENIQMSQFAVEFLSNLSETLSVDGEQPEVTMTENGYLVLASADGQATIEENVAIQHEYGAKTVLLQGDELAAQFPWLNTEDLAVGSFGPENEGWIDPYALLQAFRKKARSLGAVFVQDEVVDVIRDDDRVTGVRMESCGEISCNWLVNAAGPRAGTIAAAAGIHMPVRPRKRFIYVFDCHDGSQKPPPNMPLTFDPTGTYVRPEGKFFICGKAPAPSDDPDCLDLDVDHDYFDNAIWPDLAHRIPAFEAIKVVNSWAGHYAYNTLDQNAIIGAHPDVENMFFANGFSGHGLQQSPAVGRAISELIIQDRFVSLDLTRFGFDRIMTETPILEKNGY